MTKLSVLVPLLAAAFAWSSGSSWVAFPSIVMQAGNGPTALHLPLLGLVLAAAYGFWSARRLRLRVLPACVWTSLVFAVTHLMCVLGVQWQRDVYDTVLAARPGSSSYLAFGNAYALGVFAVTSILAVWLAGRIRDGKSPVDAVVDRMSHRRDGQTFMVASLVPVPILALTFLGLRGWWGATTLLLVLDAGAVWLVTPRTNRVLPPAMARLRGVLDRDAVIVVGLMVLSFVVRYYWGHHVLVVSGPAVYPIASDDGATYHQIAMTIASGHLPVDTDNFYWGGLLYWYMLAAIYKVWGIGNFNAVIVVQAVLGALVPVATYVIARGIFRSKLIAALSGLLAALHLLLIFLSGVLGMEALYLPLLYVGLAWLVVLLGRTERSALQCLGIGIVLGLANVTRVELFGYPILLLVLTAAMAVRGPSRARSLANLRVAWLVSVAFLAVWAGQGLYNYFGYGTFSLLSGQAPMVFKRGSYHISENVVLDAMGFNPFRDKSAAIHVFFSHPAEVTKLLAVGFIKRLRLFIFLPGSGIFNPLTLTSSNAILDFFPGPVSFPSVLESYALMLASIGLGAFAFVKKRIQGLVSLALVAHLTMLNAVVDVPSARHRASLTPLFLIAFVKGIDVVLGLLRTADRAPLGAASRESRVGPSEDR